MAASPAAALAADPAWERARALLAGGELDAAERELRALADAHPQAAGPPALLARVETHRGRMPEAAALLRRAWQLDRDDPMLVLECALGVHLQGDDAGAIDVLESSLGREGDLPTAWLLLGRLRELAGDGDGALAAWNQAQMRARARGEWRDRASTPAAWRELIAHAVSRVRAGRRALYFGVLDALRAAHGAQALKRVEHAVRAHLREVDDGPADARQRPRFLYFPGLPAGPWHDPTLQPWARPLADAFDDIRAEAIAAEADGAHLPNFIDPPKDGPADTYVDGAGPAPAWEAYSFWRGGKRYDDHHVRCPKTSALLESIELCRIDHESPEILYSVLRPGTHIKPHHGVSNIRLVMHLPLVVPEGCALHLPDHGEHAWQEGRLVMFDDTYLHEAWNRSARTRTVLLMDCWNPHLDGVERVALKRFVEAVSGLHRSAR